MYLRIEVGQCLGHEVVRGDAGVSIIPIIRITPAPPDRIRGIVNDEPLAQLPVPAACEERTELRHARPAQGLNRPSDGEQVGGPPADEASVYAQGSVQREAPHAVQCAMHPAADNP